MIIFLRFTIAYNKFIYNVFVRCGSKPTIATHKNYVCVLLNVNGNFLAGGQVVFVKEHDLFRKRSLLIGKQILFVIVHAAVNLLDFSYNTAVRIVHLGEIIGNIAEIAAQLLDHDLVVTEVLVYGALKLCKVTVVAVYQFLKGLCVFLICHKRLIHRDYGILVYAVVEIIIFELLEIRLCFRKVLFAPFCYKCFVIVRRSDIHGGKVAYHKSIICTDSGNAINICNGRLVVFVVNNRNGVVAGFCEYIVDGSHCACGKHGLLPILGNHIILGRLAHHKSKPFCIQPFAKVGGICGFCVCFNGNAVAHLCVLGYGSNADKSGALFNALRLC